MSVAAVTRSFTEKGQAACKGFCLGAGAAALSYGLYLAHFTGSCQFYGKIPSCGNDPALTFSAHAVVPAVAILCAAAAKREFQKVFS